ncbi:DNA-directed RNA polymerases I, II, and III subunit RPABC4 [Marchantia polymorpha subsp. ruderalis]|uniref:Uncharacterized protein n=2 Tax=Marchantia polymorpha TaxID=3197 RepID=A0AAF6BA09_MARPO|nr:hypothetical protein MARPO_0119s0017 [Marchantia polymorpha]PTQ30809.1 hypothetical protein MARPO_0119s0017 [Marchantia polymorpha]BBN08843.1 hypothetical protein Mp_4g14940 [Marchantia polymorpha subsp. ruderalis]BBN08844.1 hypothetical protein Mp_4g14940 [Marchantia polymorpha subsp. ruderalis]|eukprot:PTQ30808.1 hypothetical protein MARPO_0119s0017 [Marchantia polymorpha]
MDLYPLEEFKPPEVLPPTEDGKVLAPPQLTVAYLCGDCGAEVRLKPKDVIQCRECGYRILYKKRTPKIVQYEAR